MINQSLKLKCRQIKQPIIFQLIKERRTLPVILFSNIHVSKNVLVQVNKQRLGVDRE